MSHCTSEDGHLAYQSDDGVVVSLMPEWTSGEHGWTQELRMEVRYEVEAILRHRGTGDSLEYQVRLAFS